MTIESIAAGGDGVARADGLAVFVPRSAPGDVADIRFASRGRFGRGEILSLVQAAAGRVTPRCQHYLPDRCGGCQLQHLDYAAQLEAKRRIVRDALTRIARRDVELPEIVASPAPWAYRAKLTLAMRMTSDTWVFGLHAYDNPDHVFSLRECPITDPAIVTAWREIYQASRHLPRERSLRGAVRLVEGELAFVLEGGTRWDAASEFARECRSLHFIRWKPSLGTSVTVVDRRRGTAPAAAFEQVNPGVAAQLRQDVARRALARSPRSALDLYAGNGATAKLLADGGATVTAVEVDREAVAFMEQHQSAGVTPMLGRVEDVIASLLPVDVVVLNPPRAGVQLQVTSALNSAPQPAVIYVSCDPATLARDLSRLPAYRIASVTLYDMFPQTAHVETLCELVPEVA